MLQAAQAACAGPGETFARPRSGHLQCRILLEPETTAALILEFDGSVERLPELVLSLSVTRAGEGYLVTGCSYLSVPRKDGSIVRVVPADPTFATDYENLLMAAGGKSVRDVPQAAAEHCFAQ